MKYSYPRTLVGIKWWPHNIFIIMYNVYLINCNNQQFLLVFISYCFHNKPTKLRKQITEKADFQKMYTLMHFLEKAGNIVL